MNAQIIQEVRHPSGFSNRNNPKSASADDAKPPGLRMSYLFDVFVDPINPNLRGVFVRRRLKSIQSSISNGTGSRFGEEHSASAIRFFPFSKNNFQAVQLEAEAFVQDYCKHH